MKNTTETNSQNIQINEITNALEALILFTKPTKSNAVVLNNAHQVLAKYRVNKSSQ